MPTNALDAFRAQREAADAVFAKMAEVSELLRSLRAQGDELARDDQLRTLLRQEETWLAQAQRTVGDVRQWREMELHRFWPGVVRRWVLALAFGLAGVWAAGAGYAWIAAPYAAELAALRARIESVDLVERRLMTMTPNERRQLDALMKWKTEDKR